MPEQVVVEVAHGAFSVTHSARSDVGRVRSVNEDSFLAGAPVWLVADGMGGHARGDAASAAAVDTFRRHFEPGRPATPELVLDAIHTANEAVRALSSDDDRGTGVAGTTLTGVALVEPGGDEPLSWMVFNVGDSRVYRWDGVHLQPMTIDHSAVRELVEAGVISERDAERHPDRNVITRALGAADWVEPDVRLIPVGVGDTFVVCSDGLTRELDEDDIERVLIAGDGRVPGLAGELVDLAVERGGNDNVTAVVLAATYDAGPGASDDDAGAVRGSV